MAELLASIRSNLAAYASALQRHADIAALQRYLELDLGADGWFTVHYLAPLEAARLAAREPRWWIPYRERCLRKERWSHPVVDVAQRTARYGHWVDRNLEHAELAYHVVLFYSTLYAALDGDIPNTSACYVLLERARTYAMQFAQGPQQ